MTVQKKTREQRQRIPAGMPRQRLKVEGLDNSKRGYWATESQIEELLDAGYRFVSHDETITVGQDGYIPKGKMITRPASRSDDKKLYLMEIDKDIYAENQRIKQDAIKAQETAIFERGDTQHEYVDKANSKITENIGA